MKQPSQPSTITTTYLIGYPAACIGNGRINDKCPGSGVHARHFANVGSPRGCLQIFLVHEQVQNIWMSDLKHKVRSKNDFQVC